MNCQEILDYEFESQDFHEPISIRQYLRKLMVTLWNEGEGFNSKRPFGNSGWEYELYVALVKCGAVDGVLDEDDFITSFDINKANQTVFDLIDYIFEE